MTFHFRTASGVSSGNVASPPVQTRSFIREKDGKQQFFELSWVALEAEVATGKVGTNGRVTEYAFTSPAELQDFIDQQVAKAKKGGYVERAQGVGAVEPEVPPDDDPLADVDPVLRRTGFLPNLEPGEGAPRGSRLGGRPFVPQGEAWPMCGGCGRQLELLVQLSWSELPEPAQKLLPPGLYQLFLCDSPCQVEEEGWNPFARSTLARMLPLDTPGSVASGADGGSQLPPRRISSWAVRDELPRYVELASRLDSERADEAAEAARERGLEAAPGEKLLGWPHWIQDAEHPRCRRCPTLNMNVIFQVDSNKGLPVSFADSGIGFWVRCDRCGEMTFLYQSC